MLKPRKQPSTPMKLLKKKDDTAYYELSDGRKISIELEDDGRLITVRTSEQEKIGHFELKALHEEDIDEDDYYAREEAYKLMWMGLEKLGTYKHQGIGTACIQFHKDYYGAPIYASPNDGQTRDDGSHLVGDGPYFVAKMVKLGLIEDNDERDEDYNDEHQKDDEWEEDNDDRHDD
jgi:hypothetical protein